MHWSQLPEINDLSSDFRPFFLNPSDNADRQVSTCSIQWCQKTTFEEVVACALVVLGPSYDIVFIFAAFRRGHGKKIKFGKLNMVHKALTCSYLREFWNLIL